MYAISIIFTLGVLLPKSGIDSRSNRHLTQSRLQVIGCTAERYCLLLVVVQGPGSFRVRSTFLYDVRLRSYGTSKLPNFRILAYFSLYKTPKTYLPVTSLQFRVYITEWFRFFHFVAEGPKGCLRDQRFPATSGRRAGDPQTRPIVAYGKWLYRYTGRQIWIKDVWKRAILRTNVLCPPNIFAPTPKITPKTPFWGPLNAKRIIQRAIRQSHVNGATTLKLYGFIGIGKYLGRCQNFSSSCFRGAQGPLM